MSQRGITGSGGALFGDEGQDGLMHRAFLRGGGASAEEVRLTPVIGIANSASDLNPCNKGLAYLVKEVKRGVRDAGGLPLEFPTISISEPFTRPTSLYLRNLMSIDVEEMITVSPIDGVVLMGGCDKTVPAQLMGAISAGKPATMVTAGPRPVSCHRDNTSLTVDDAWPMCDRRRVGEVDDAEWLEFEGNLNADVGTCNVMGTASTMAAIAELLGFALPGSAFAESTSATRREIAYRTGVEAVAAVKRGTAPRDLVTLASLENAFRTVTALGGSTNSVIHLEAIAGRAGHMIGLDNFQEWSRTTPYLANVRPGGTETLPAIEAAGGVPSVLARMSDLLHLDERTALGTSWGEVLGAARPDPSPAIAERATPLAERGALVVLRGNLAPGGAILKTAGAGAGATQPHRGRAVVFDGLDDLNARIDDPALEVDADSILVLRGLGAVGAPGMPEVGHIPIPAKLHRQGVTDMVRISDARMSGTSTGMVALHVSPEAAVGGPLAYLRDGDEIVLDPEAGTLDHLVDPEAFALREPFRSAAGPARGFASLHVRHVLQPEYGCDFDFLRDPGAPGAAPLPARH
ncbi:dihydroxy-acid dehydratase [Leucobacter chromiireducens]|uniref:Dihydroxy-acid dehydratase n=1 Tax=Leucobacter chromiireducens subsp. solipictus TaxID=398235 RepID=A0ABS1SEP0_9MICO|nr:dihydroxy-acid dehydratase [Leucobacter chromiireducens]MBL3679013.1 dihydroxy-acid dehydratase [Leucobacter chromiireducens subsp. solipictus]